MASHEQEHEHGEHDHGVGHGHAPANFGRAFAIGIALNAGFVIVEVVYGFLCNSVALSAAACLPRRSSRSSPRWVRMGERFPFRATCIAGPSSILNPRSTRRRFTSSVTQS